MNQITRTIALAIPSLFTPNPYSVFAGGGGGRGGRSHSGGRRSGSRSLRSLAAVAVGTAWPARRLNALEQANALADAYRPGRQDHADLRRQTPLVKEVVMFPVTRIRKVPLTRITVVGLLTYGLLLSAGCASMPRTPLSSSDNNLHLDNGSVYLLSIKTDNKFHTGWPPEVQHLVVRDDGSGEEIDFFTIEGSLWAKATHDAFTTKRDQGSESLVGLNLPPGSYHLWTIAGGATKGIGVAALSSSFSFPFDVPFGSQGKEIVYLGNIEMVNRERKSDEELPSAPALPLINPGFSGSTFDVTIADKYEEDVPRFREKFPALGTREISKRVLPQWQRPKRTEKKGN